MLRRRPVAGLIVGFVLVACGGSPAATTDESPSTTAAVSSTLPATSSTTTTIAASTTSTPTLEIVKDFDYHDFSGWGKNPLDILAVSAREVWAVTAGLIGHLEDGDWTHWRPLAGVFSGVAVAPDGTVWVAASSGVFSFDGAAWTRRFDGLARAVGVSEDGTVWIGGTFGAENGLLWLARWDGESWVRFDEAGPATSGSDPAPPLNMTVLPDGDVWIVGAMFGWGGDLLVRYDGTTMGRVGIGLDPGPGFNLQLAAAPNGDLLVGGFVHNLDRQYRVARFDGEQWSEWPAHHWPSAETSGASDMAVGPDGVLWFAFEGGLASVDGTEWTIRIEGPGVSAVDVAPDGTVLYADSDGVHVFSTP